VLDLNSTAWADITASPGGNGMLTAQLLAHLRDGDESAWGELYQQVCDQNSVGEVAFVAAPHMVAIARVSTPRIRALLLSTVGSIVASAKCYPADAAKPRNDGGRSSIAHALRLSYWPPSRSGMRRSIATTP